jgi:hypothetical protein
VTELTIVLLMLAGILTFLDWRKGLVMCVLLGIAQDPLRKLAPGQPVYYVILVGVIFGIAWLRAALMGIPLGPSVILGWRQNLKVPFSAFIFLVVLQAMHSLARYDSILMPSIGLLVWLAPIPAVLLAYQFAARRGVLGIRSWMLLYVITALISLSGVYLEYQGVNWRVLGEIGDGQVIYDVGTVLKAYSGFYRASEIAAWHAAAIACFIFILSIGKRPTLMRIFMALVLIGLLVSLGILTGRRKMLVEITVFVSCYLFLVAWIQRGTARLAMGVLLAGAVGYIAIVGFVAPDLIQRSATKTMSMENAQRIQGYATRGQSVFADIPARVNELGIQPVLWAVGRFGWLGAGLGTGSQGTNAIAEANNIDRGAAEGGLGKIAMELGIPGLLMAVWLVVALGKHLHRQLVYLARVSQQHARMAYGLASFLAANAATFTVATQAYSDLFVLLILGWCLGFLLAMPMLAAKGADVRGRAAPRYPDLAGSRVPTAGGHAAVRSASGQGLR